MFYKNCLSLASGLQYYNKRMCVITADSEIVKMLKLIILSLAVMLSYCLVSHVHGDCTAGQISIIQQQWADTFNSQQRLRQFAQTYFDRSALYCVRKSRALNETSSIRATECHLPCGITQCYLPPDTSEHTPP